MDGQYETLPGWQGEMMKRLKPIESFILTIRGHKVMIDSDLAAVYGVETRALNQAVKRNTERFPKDFVFQLNSIEKTGVITICDHLARLKFAKSLPYAFTEHGAIMAATVLSSPQAVSMSVYVVREPHKGTDHGLFFKRADRSLSWLTSRGILIPSNAAN